MARLEICETGSSFTLILLRFAFCLASILCLLTFFVPMEKATLIAQIHDAPVMAVIVVTGGGAQAIADILAVPGASRTLLEALVPYSDKSLTKFLGSSP